MASRRAPNSAKVIEFNAQLDKYAERAGERLDHFALEFVMRVCEAVIVGNQYGPGTPVRSGFARGNWVIAINGPAPGTLVQNHNPDGTFDAAGMAAQELAKLANFKAGDFLNMANNAVYAYRLETGHSQQAPEGMVRIVVAAAPTIARDILAEMGV